MTLRRRCEYRFVGQAMVGTSGANEAAKSAPRKRNAERTKAALLAAALKEFSQQGYAGARTERVAKTARCNIRMLYHYFGKKHQLYVAVLESAYADIRAREAELQLDVGRPMDSLLELMRFTFRYFDEHPRFEGLLRTENMMQGRFVRQSQLVAEAAFPLRRLIADIIAEGEAQGAFRCGLHPEQIYMTITALSRFHLANAYSMSALLGTDLTAAEWKVERLAHCLEVLQAYLSPVRPERDQVEAPLLQTLQAAAAE